MARLMMRAMDKAPLNPAMDRRQFLRGIRGAGAASLLRGTPAFAAAGETAAFDLEEELYTNPRFSAFTHWLGHVSHCRDETEIIAGHAQWLTLKPDAAALRYWGDDIKAYLTGGGASLEREMADFGAQLHANPPSLTTIREIVAHPYFAESPYADFVEGMSRQEEVARLSRLANFDGRHWQDIVAEQMKARATALQQLRESASGIDFEERTGQARQGHEAPEPAPRRMFADAAAARKAGGYPIPAAIPESEQKRLQVGRHASPHVSSCEHYGPVLDRNASLAGHYTRHS